MGWTYGDLMALDEDRYDELIDWFNDELCKPGTD
jgi:hypothetical protein